MPGERQGATCDREAQAPTSKPLQAPLAASHAAVIAKEEPHDDAVNVAQIRGFDFRNYMHHRRKTVKINTTPPVGVTPFISGHQVLSSPEN